VESPIARTEWRRIAFALLALALTLALSPVRSAAVAHVRVQGDADPDAILQAFLADAFPSLRFVGPCEEEQVARSEGGLCATLVDVRDMVVVYRVGFIGFIQTSASRVAFLQTEISLWVFIAPFAGEWRTVAVESSPGWSTVEVPWPWPAEESTPLSEALARLEAELPPTASAVMVRLFRFAATSLAWLQFEQADDAEPRAVPGSTPARPRRFDRIYVWTGTGWMLRIDSYQLATELFGPPLIGRLTQGLPRADTALVEMNLQLLPRGVAETGAMPDVLALVVGYRAGPTRVAEVQPALALVPVTGPDLAVAFTLDLTIVDVHAWPDLVVRFGDEILVTAPLFRRGDRPCCPSGTLVLRIGWQEGGFVIVEWCERAGRGLTSCR
jgi:hypothetical protein